MPSKVLTRPNTRKPKAPRLLFSVLAALHGEASLMIAVKLRVLQQKDKTAVMSMLREPEVMRFLEPCRALTEDEVDSWFESALINPTRFAIEEADTDEFIGF